MNTDRSYIPHEQLRRINEHKHELHTSAVWMVAGIFLRGSTPPPTFDDVASRDERAKAIATNPKCNSFYCS